MPNIKTLDQISVPDFLDMPMDTGIPIMNELINGSGPLRSQVITLDAFRGSGKTTLLLQMMDSMMQQTDMVRALFVSQEEPDFQLKKAARRLGLVSALPVIGDDETVYLEDICTLTETHDIIVVDSYSCVESRSGIKGDKKRMRLLKDAAKQNACAVILVLHQTKSGREKGGSDVGHMGDTCISMIRGDEETYGTDGVRILKLTKNRFGAMGEVTLKLTRSGWDFLTPIEAKVNNDANRTESNTKSAQMRQEREVLLRFMWELSRAGKKMYKDEIFAVIDDDDPAAFDRHLRHLKQFESAGLVITYGRAAERCWELTKAGRSKIGIDN